MKSLQESPALLTVHESSAGNYIIRVTSTENRNLIVGVTKLLQDANSLVVITPNDIKLFHANAVFTPVVAVDSFVEEPDQMEAVARLEQNPILNHEPTEPVEGLPEGAQVVGETAQGTKVVRRKRSPGPQVATPETCGRCQGHGRIQMLLPDGGAGESACPVCRGEGSIPRFGARR